MRVLFDTCVIIDYLEDRKLFSDDSFQLMEKAIKKEIVAYITEKSITDIYYVYHRETHSKEIAVKSIKILLSFLNVLDTLKQDAIKALEMKYSSDLEDATMIETAVREKLDFIITRNTKDYIKSPIKAITPKDF